MYESFYLWARILLIYGIAHVLIVKIPALRRHLAYHNRRLGEVLDGEMTLYRLSKNPGTELSTLRKGYGGTQVTKLHKNTSKSDYFEQQAAAAYLWEAGEWLKVFGNLVMLFVFSSKTWPVLAYPFYVVTAGIDMFMFGKLMLLMMTDEEEKGTGLTFLGFMLTHAVELLFFGMMVYSYPWGEFLY